MKQELTLTIIGWMVRGTDRRTGEPFEEFIPMDTRPGDAKLDGMRERVRATFALLGYDVEAMDKTDTVEVKLDLMERYLAAGGKTPDNMHGFSMHPPSDGNHPDEPKKAVTNPGGLGALASSPNKRKGTSARLYDYIQRHPEPDVFQRIADATGGKLTAENVQDLDECRTTCGMWFKYVAEALDKLEAEERQSGEPQPAGDTSEVKQVNKGMLPEFFGSGPKTEKMSPSEEEKLRRKTQKALIFWVQKHGDNFKPIVRATMCRVTEATLNVMLVDPTAFEAKHWLAVNKALKKLALEEARGD